MWAKLSLCPFGIANYTNIQTTQYQSQTVCVIKQQTLSHIKYNVGIDCPVTIFQLRVSEIISPYPTYFYSVLHFIRPKLTEIAIKRKRK